MKARTAKERAVEEATAKYIQARGIGSQILEAARPKFYVRIPLNYHDKGVWCTNCGGKIDFNPDLLVNIYNENHPPVITCPHCGEKLTRCRTIQRGVGHYLHRDYNIVLKAEVHGDWQVLRYFYIYFEAMLGGQPKLASPVEIVRRWYNIAHGGKPVVWSTGANGSWYGCGFALSGQLSLKQEDRQTAAYCGYGKVNYRILEDAVTPGSQWHPLLKRDGFNGSGTMRLLGVRSFDVPLVFAQPQLVTLYKSKNYRLLRYYADDAKDGFQMIRDDWPSLKVALRHRYRIKDAGLWHDYLKQLRELGEDVRSPRWICPDNLRLAHDLTQTRINRLRALKKIEEERKRAAVAEAKYARKIAAFRDLRLTGEGVVIVVIPSVEDVRQEGAAMHHCVFSANYYGKETSLLLSARNEAGKRLETIEFSLASGKVLQSRAACNKTTPKHKQILKMMEAASAQIVETWKRSKPEKPEITIKPVAELVRAFV